MLPLILIASVLAFADHFVHPAYAETGIILVPPQSQYLLEGDVANITCKTGESREAYWTINGTALSTHHGSEQQRFEKLGVAFTESSNSGYYNLTMTVPACVGRFLNDIRCNAQARNFHVFHSNPVRVLAFKTFRPNPPSLTIDVVYHDFSQPELSVTLSAVPLWPDYNTQEFNITFTNSNNGSIIENFTVQNDPNVTNSVLVQHLRTLLEAVGQQCAVMNVSATAVSNEYGESERVQRTLEVSQIPGNFTDDGISCTTLFHSNGSMSHVALQIKLPLVCDYQPINYTVVISEVNNDIIQVIFSRPYSHTGAGVVHQDIQGLNTNTMYMVMVQVETATGTSESKPAYFDTASEFHSCTEASVTPTKSSFSFEVVLSVSLIMVVVILVTFVILSLVCYWMVRRRSSSNGENSTHRVYNSMVPNPIYDGPVYDRVQPHFDPLTRNSGSLPTKSSPPHYDDLSNMAAGMNGRFDEYPHLPHLADKSHSSTNVYTLTDGPQVASVPSTNGAASLKKNGAERNKLGLTLPKGGGGGGGAGRGGDMSYTGHESTDTYVKMSIVGTLRSQYGQEDVV